MLFDDLTCPESEFQSVGTATEKKATEKAWQIDESGVWKCLKDLSVMWDQVQAE